MRTSNPADSWRRRPIRPTTADPASCRAAKQNPKLKKVDAAFREKFRVVNSGRELEVQRLYQKTAAVKGVLSCGKNFAISSPGEM